MCIQCIFGLWYFPLTMSLFGRYPIVSQGRSVLKHLRRCPAHSCCSVTCLTLHDPMDYRLHCPSPSPGVCSNSCPLNQWIKNMQSCIFLCFTLCLSCLSNQAAFFWWGQSSNPHKRLYCNLDGQGSLVCCSPWFCRVRHDWVTELNWTELRRTLWGFPRTDFPYTMSSAFLLSVENL